MKKKYTFVEHNTHTHTRACNLYIYIMLYGYTWARRRHGKEVKRDARWILCDIDLSPFFLFPFFPLSFFLLRSFKQPPPHRESVYSDQDTFLDFLLHGETQAHTHTLYNIIHLVTAIVPPTAFRPENCGKFLPFCE